MGYKCSNFSKNEEISEIIPNFAMQYQTTNDCLISPQVPFREGKYELKNT